MSRILSLTAVTVVAIGSMLALPARTEAAVPVGVSVGVGPVVGTFSTYPAYPAPVVVVPPVYPAPVVVRPAPVYYPGYYRGHGYYGHPHHHYRGWHR